MIDPMVKTLLDAGAHFGHQTHRWNPKMRRYIFGEKNGIYLIDLEKTAGHLAEAQRFLRSVAAEGGPILFVGTKRQAQPIVAEEAVRCGQFFVNTRWLGGLLTNFLTIRKSIERLHTLRRWREDGTLERLTKKEVARAEKEMAKLEKGLKGILEMPRLPRAIYVIDAKREETAVREARRLEIPIVALVDTDSDPDPIRYVIPANDDAIRSIRLVTSLVADAVLEGRRAYLAGLAEEQARKATREEAAPAPAPEPEPAVPEALPEVELAVAGGPDVAAAGVVVAPEPLVDDVEAIVPEATLKTQVEAAEHLPKKKRIPKAKIGPEEAGKEDVQGGG